MSRADEAGRALRVGVVTILSLVVLASGIWLLGESSRVWASKESYSIRFPNVQGLTHGSAVSISGYTIGTVKEIRLPDDLAAGHVEVVVQVERAHAKFIREDTLARLRTMGLLGDRYIDLSPGTLTMPALPPGATIQSEQPTSLEEILEQGGSVAENMAVLTTSVRHIVEKVARGEGLIGKLVTDSAEGRQLGDDLHAVVTSLRSVSEKLDTGSGLAGRLLNDPGLAPELKKALTSLRQLVQKFEAGDGLAARFFTDKEFADETVANLQEASQHMAALTARLDNDKGLLQQLMQNEAYADEVLTNLKQTSASLATVTRRIESGEGSLGKLIADETLYEGANDILAGARKSRITRWFLTRSQKVGAEDRLESVRGQQK